MISTGQCPACHSTNSYSATNCLDCKGPLPWGGAVADLKKQVDAANALNVQLQQQTQRQTLPQQALPQRGPTNGPPPLPTRPQPFPVSPTSPSAVPLDMVSGNVFHEFAQAFIGRLSEPFAYVDSTRAAVIGVVCMLAAIVCNVIGTHLLTQDLTNLLHSLFPFTGGDAAATAVTPANPLLPPDPNALVPPPTVTPEASSGIAFWKLLVITFAPWFAVLATCALARVSFGTEKRDFQGDIFIAGVTMLPFAIVVLLAGVLGYANWEISAVLSVFAMTYTVMFLYRGLTTISAVREVAAAICVPLVLVGSAILMRIVFFRLVTA